MLSGVSFFDAVVAGLPAFVPTLTAGRPGETLLLGHRLGRHLSHLSSLLLLLVPFH